MFENIVVGVKPGQAAEPLVKLALRSASGGARITLVSLVKVGFEEHELETLQRTEAELHRLIEGVAADGPHLEAHARVVVAHPGQELAAIADEQSADLIVVGMAKRTRVGKALLGSDTQSALLRAASPVLVSRLDDAW